MYLRVIEKLKASDFDAFLIQDEANRNFLCNKGNYFLPGIMLITKDEVFLATPSRNIRHFKELYEEYTVIKGGLVELSEIAKEKNIKKIGYENFSVAKSTYDDMKLMFNESEFMEGGHFIEDIRVSKTESEIKLLQEATSLSDKAYVEFLNHLKIGITEKQARAKFDSILMQFGADEFSFPTLLSSGSRTFLPHSAPTDKIIEKGDLVLMDFGIVLNGYCSDTTRAVVMGSADERQKQMYELVLKAQKNALENIKAGITARQADAYARDVITAVLNEGCFDYGLGHGIGMKVHEKPRFHPNNEYIMLENTAMSVEPGIYIEGWGGIRIEDILIVGKEKGGRNLTSAPKEELLEI